MVFKFSETVIMIFFFRRRGWGDNFIEIKIPVFIPESPLAVHMHMQCNYETFPVLVIE